MATVLDVSQSGLRLELRAPISGGVDIKITVPDHVVIFGEVRYCRPARDVFHAGVLIHDVIHSSAEADQHPDDDHLGLFIVGKGFTAPEVIKLREHLIRCEACRVRLDEVDRMLNPKRKE